MQTGLGLCVFAAISLAMTGSIAFAAEYNLRFDMSISQVRSQLLKDGWTPVRIDKKIYTDGTTGNHDGAEGQILFEAGFFEVEDCSGTEAGFCTFNYQKNGRCLRIITQGEYFSPQDEPGLLRWDNNCPD